MISFGNGRIQSVEQTDVLCMIWDSASGGYEKFYLLEYNAM
jgi:hypothetical protein